MDQRQTKDWRELCKAAANEPNPKKLMALVAEITKALDERDGRRNATRDHNRDGLRNVTRDHNNGVDLSVLSGAA